MPREDHEGRRLAFLPAQQGEVDAVQVAEAICTTLQAIDAALSPILGSRGVAALYKRSLYLTGAKHPWLAGVHESVGSTMDLAVVRPVIAQRTSAEAVAGGNALLHNFHQLLASLVGPSLTERLLRSVRTDSSSGAPAQDTSS